MWRIVHHFVSWSRWGFDKTLNRSYFIGFLSFTSLVLHQYRIWSKKNAKFVLFSAREQWSNKVVTLMSYTTFSYEKPGSISQTSFRVTINANHAFAMVFHSTWWYTQKINTQTLACENLFIENGKMPTARQIIIIEGIG